MSFASLWTILSTYRPNAARQARDRPPQRFGVFEPRYLPPKYGVIRPKTDREAQALYNHIRTVAFWLDASPLLADLGLPFRAGIDDIISLVPLYGDIASGILQLYQVWLSFVFGVPLQIIGWMILNVLLDTVAGIVPIIGDIIDNLFKSNLRNLALLENWLLNDQYTAAKYHILLMPESDEFVPGPSARWKGWFGGKVDREEMAARDRERATGKVRKTRRMGREEGAWEVPVSGGPTQDGLD